jgi:hypothetical protein
MITWIGVGIVLVIIYLVIRQESSEKFTSRSEKANDILSWFDSNPNPKYTKFVADNPEMNALDYGTALKLRARNQLDLAHLQRFL